MSGTLVLVRHGQSDWNLKNLFTGWKDPDLSPQGVAEAKAAGQRLKAKGLKFDLCFTSALTRAQHTLQLILVIMVNLLASIRMTPAKNGVKNKC
jgi:2,3-bisphosphoglycerate-dependent phosphoglycerate mutase